MPDIVEELIAAQRESADAQLPTEVAAYYEAGSFAGATTAEAAEAWSNHRLVPRSLRDVTTVNAQSSVLGLDTGPVGVAPCSLQTLGHPDGEVAMAQGAKESGALLVVSSNTGRTFADIAATGVDWWLQLYLTEDRTLSVPLIERALEAGARAIVLTADTPTVGPKHARAEAAWSRVTEDRTHVESGGRHPVPGAAKAMDLGPHDVAWLINAFHLPVVVKGVLNSEDARRCVEVGASAVWVSNHGGRQADRVVSTAQALQGVAAAVGHEAEVYVDGGLRRGSDVLVARALGASHVFVGRPALWALAAEGRTAVCKLLSAWRTEVELNLRLCGYPDLATVDLRLLADQELASGKASLSQDG